MYNMNTKSARSDKANLIEASWYSYIDIAKAIELYEGIKPLPQPSFIADLQYLVYRLNLRQGRYDEAKQAAMLAVEYARDLGDQQRLCYALMAHANIRLILHDAQNSHNIALESRSVAHTLADAPAIVKAEFLLGRIYLNRNEYRLAREHFFAALNHISSYFDDKESGDITLSICASYMHEGNWADAIAYGLKAIKIKERYQYDVDSLNNARKVGWLVFACGEYIYVPVRDDAVLADTYYNVGASYRFLGDIAQAISYLLHAISIKEKIGDIGGIANCSNELGMLHKQKGDSPKALEYFEQSFRLFSDLKNTSALGYVLINIADLKAEDGDMDAAIEMIAAAQQQFSLLEDYHGIAISKINYAVLLRKTGNLSAAVDNIMQALAANGMDSPVFHQTRCYHELGLCYVELRRTEEAIEALHKALALAQEQGMKNELIAIHQDLCSYYQSQECFREALFHHQEFERIKDQLFNEESDRREKNLLILHEVEKHKRSAEESRQQLLRAQAEIEAKTQQLSDFALRIVEKQEFLEMIERGLERIQHSSDDEKNRMILDLLRTVRNEASVVEEDWRAFQMQFKGMQQDFINALTRLHPNLTPTELKICALLRMNLRTKEIANILHIGSKAVENHRVKVRKKMGLDRDANLVKVLLETGME